MLAFTMTYVAAKNNRYQREDNSARQTIEHKMIKVCFRIKHILAYSYAYECVNNNQAEANTAVQTNLQ